MVGDCFSEMRSLTLLRAFSGAGLAKNTSDSATSSEFIGKQLLDMYLKKRIPVHLNNIIFKKIGTEKMTAIFKYFPI